MDGSAWRGLWRSCSQSRPGAVSHGHAISTQVFLHASRIQIQTLKGLDIEEESPLPADLEEVGL